MKEARPEEKNISPKRKDTSKIKNTIVDEGKLRCWREKNATLNRYRGETGDKKRRKKARARTRSIPITTNTTSAALPHHLTLERRNRRLVHKSSLNYMRSKQLQAQGIS